MLRSRPITLAGIGAAVLANYWALESLLARRTDFDGAWISDLAARSEAFGWRFEALAILAGLALIGFACLLLIPLGSRSSDVHNGTLALLAAGACGVLAGVATLDCAEGLETACRLDYEFLDLAHSVFSVAEVLATGAAFFLVGRGLRGGPRRLTLALFLAWGLLTLLTGLSFLGGEIDSIKGLAQRGGQLLLGCWLIALGVWADRRRTRRQRTT